MRAKPVRFARAEAALIIEKYKKFLDYMFPDYIILGSFYRNEKTVGDIDVLCDRNKVNKNIHYIEEVKRKIRRWYSYFGINLDGLNFNIYCCDKEYIPSAALLMKGPSDRFNQLKQLSQQKGYYLTHFGLLKITEEVKSENQDEECYLSENKILFETEQEYLDFIFKNY